jgi:hypothetical protein
VEAQGISSSSRRCLRAKRQVTADERDIGSCFPSDRLVGRGTANCTSGADDLRYSSKIGGTSVISVLRNRIIVAGMVAVLETQ